MRARIFELSAEEAKRQNAELSSEEIADIVNEALEWTERA
ncbi:MAG: ribbon-helix-helix domain-containing protein [Acetobacteraceae bacterium]